MCLLVMRKQSLREVKQFINLSKLCKPHRNYAQLIKGLCGFVAPVLSKERYMWPTVGHVDFSLDLFFHGGPTHPQSWRWSCPKSRVLISGGLALPLGSIFICLLVNLFTHFFSGGGDQTFDFPHARLMSV